MATENALTLTIMKTSNGFIVSPAQNALPINPAQAAAAINCADQTAVNTEIASLVSTAFTPSS